MAKTLYKRVKLHGMFNDLDPILHLQLRLYNDLFISVRGGGIYFIRKNQLNFR